MGELGLSRNTRTCNSNSKHDEIRLRTAVCRGDENISTTTWTIYIYIFAKWSQTSYRNVSPMNREKMQIFSSRKLHLVNIGNRLIYNHLGPTLFVYNSCYRSTQGIHKDKRVSRLCCNVIATAVGPQLMTCEPANTLFYLYILSRHVTVSGPLSACGNSASLTEQNIRQTGNNRNTVKFRKHLTWKKIQASQPQNTIGQNKKSTCTMHMCVTSRRGCDKVTNNNAADMNLSC